METATLTCPRCGATQQTDIPERGCLAFYTCTTCKETIAAPADTCCVVCAYGDRRCPAAAAEREGGSKKSGGSGCC